MPKTAKTKNACTCPTGPAIGEEMSANPKLELVGVDPLCPVHDPNDPVMTGLTS